MPTSLPLALALLAWGEPTPAPVRPLDVVAALETALADAIAKAEPSVVAIAREKSENDETTAVRGREPTRNGLTDRRLLMGRVTADTLFGPDVLFTSDVGSGVVVGDGGQILTTFHMVRGAKSIYVRAAGRQDFEAEIIAADPRSDLAVIAPRDVPGVPAPKLKALAIGDSTKLRKGSFLVALGNPFNAARDGKPSASWGILANVARKMYPSSDEAQRQEFQLKNYPTLLQLDAKLNLGMSGGAVINLKGELVGLTTAAANAAGFDAQAGYAVPMDALGRKVVAALKEGKEYEYGFLGIGLDVNELTNQVMSAVAGTPAAQGGLLKFDRIVAVGDIPVTDADSLVVAINAVPAGESVTLKVVRRNKPAPIERTVRLAKLKLRTPVIATNRPKPWRGLRVDYANVVGNAPLDPEMHEAMIREGVLVTEVETGSEAEKAGLRPNQMITRVGDEPVSRPAAFFQAVAGLKGPVTLETDAGPVTIK